MKYSPAKTSSAKNKSSSQTEQSKESLILSPPKNSAIKNYLEVTDYLKREFPNISLNAGHDLNLDNLDYILENISAIKEVSIGHALVCDSIDFGLKETIKKYKRITQQKHD